MVKDYTKTVLVVDDTPQNIDVLVGILRDFYKVRAATTGERALIAIENDRPDLILLDVMMPGMDGYEVCTRLKANPETSEIPVIFVTARIDEDDQLKGFEVGAVDYITKPVSPSLVMARVSTHLALYDHNRSLEEAVRRRTHDLEATRLKVIQTLGRAAEYKDNETGNHVIRMSEYSRILAEAAGLGVEKSRQIQAAAPMHDVGKIGIPDSILQKPGKLDPDEMAIMRQHCEIGADILSGTDYELLKLAKLLALGHHERWDGTGYPGGISGENIPLEARIVAIADVFDALTVARPYKKAWDIEDAFAFLKDQRGLHFDPELVDIFLEQRDKILEVRARYRDA